MIDKLLFARGLGRWCIRAVPLGLMACFAMAGGAAFAQSSTRIFILDEKERAAVWEAVDRRDADAVVFNDMLPFKRHLFLGLIGTDPACDRIVEELKPRKIIDATSVTGLSLCRREKDRAEVMDILTNRAGPWRSFRRGAAQLGALGGPQIRRYLADLAKRSLDMAMDPDRGGFAQADVDIVVQGLMQSLTYDRLPLADLPVFSGENILAMTGLGRDGRGLDYSAAYLLARLGGLESGLSAAQISAAVQALPADLATRHRSAVKALLVRLMGRLGGDQRAAATPYLLEAASNAEDTAVRFEALRGLAVDRGSDAARLLMRVASDTGADPALRVRAVQSLLSADQLPNGSGPLAARLVADKALWVRKLGLQLLAKVDAALAQAEAISWLDGDFYLADTASRMLLDSDAGKAALTQWVAAHPDSNRSLWISRLLSGEQPERPPLETWPLYEAEAAAEQVVQLETTRGRILIRLNRLAPYNALNFANLVNASLMDDSLFHRVIPNFVAQWGASEKPALATWGTVRDNWVSGSHDFGSVGVATAGKDTGSAQFFINTFDNQHLTNRYTVVGHVISGMDVALTLQEGDRVIKAQVARRLPIYWLAED